MHVKLVCVLIVALDIDDTVTAYPLFFRKLHDAWKAEGSVLFITARPESQRQQTVAQLSKLGISVENNLLMFPLEYTFPFENEQEEARLKQLHSSWKARTCVQQGVSVLIDDCMHNVSACRSAGIFVLHVSPPLKGDSND